MKEDLTDRIMAILRRNGRASFSEISRELGSDRNLVARRVNELLDSGDLHVVASVHPDILGLRTYAHLAIRVKGPLEKLIRALSETDAVVLLTETAGSHQIVADVMVSDMTELREHIRSIRRAQEVVDIAVDVYDDVRSNFFGGTRPEPNSTVLDDIDIQIIGMLRADGRIAYGQISEKVGLSLGASRARVQRLLERRVIRIGAIRRRTHMTHDLLFGVGVCMQAATEPAVALLRDHPGLEFLATVSGRFDVMASIGFGTLSEFNELMARLRGLRTFVYAEHWLHTRIVLERYDRSLGPLSRGPAMHGRGSFATKP